MADEVDYDQLEADLLACLERLEAIGREVPSYSSLSAAVTNAVYSLRKVATAVTTIKRAQGLPFRMVHHEPNPNEKREVWRGCTMINPVLPSDFCDLPAGHYGSGEGKHRLCSMPAGELNYMPESFRLTDAKTVDEVVRLGWDAHNQEVVEEHED